VIVALTTGRGHLVIGEFPIDFGDEAPAHPQIAFYQRLDEAPELIDGSLLDTETSR